MEPEDLDIIQVTIPGKGQASEGCPCGPNLTLQESSNPHNRLLQEPPYASPLDWGDTYWFSSSVLRVVGYRICLLQPHLPCVPGVRPQPQAS